MEGLQQHILSIHFHVFDLLEQYTSTIPPPYINCLVNKAKTVSLSFSLLCVYYLEYVCAIFAPRLCASTGAPHSRCHPAFRDAILWHLLRRLVGTKPHRLQPRTNTYEWDRRFIRLCMTNQTRQTDNYLYCIQISIITWHKHNQMLLCKKRNNTP